MVIFVDRPVDKIDRGPDVPGSDLLSSEDSVLGRVRSSVIEFWGVPGRADGAPSPSRQASPCEHEDEGGWFLELVREMLGMVV